MRNAYVSVCCLAVFVIGVAGAEGDPPQLEDRLGGLARSRTSLEDQVDVAVTVYNTDLALVRDRRKVPLLPGEQALTFMDVAQRVQPETVSLRSVSEPGSIHILEQNYEYDLMTPGKLMEKYVGKQVRLISTDNEQRFTEREATLVSVNEGPIYQLSDGFYLGHPGTVVLPGIPENLVANPSLIWLIHNGAGDQEIEVTYLTQGIQWRADYVVTLARDDQSMDLAGWVTLNNRSGAQYTDAQLKLVAGEVHTVPRHLERKLARDMVMLAEAPAPMREEAFAEYHLYTLPRRTTIKDNQSKQVSLLTAAGVPAAKAYELRGQEGFYHGRMDRTDRQDVGVYLEFRNEADGGLGMPLPAGVMRVYQEDSEGMLQFVGEDHIEHTPKDEDVRLKLGNAFDIVAERVQKDFSRLGDRMTESSYEITVRNHKTTAVSVKVVEPMPGDWSIPQASHLFEKKDAHTAVFELDVPADGEVVLTYTVRVTF